MWTFDFYDLKSKKWASQDQQGAFYDQPKNKDKDKDKDEGKEEEEGKGSEAVEEQVFNRELPREVCLASAVLITPPATLGKKWTNLNVVKLEDRDTVRFDERFEATTGKAIAIPNPWEE